MIFGTTDRAPDEMLAASLRPLRVLQVSTFDANGGAEKVAWDLFRTYRARGLDSWLAVGSKRGNDPDVVPIPRSGYHNSWDRPWLALERRLHPFQGAGYAVCRTLLRALAHPSEEFGGRLGVEDFNHPGSRRLLQLTEQKPDIVHCHNLHGGYFDLRALPALSRNTPVVMTLHDGWLLSGHCSHSFDCERWKSGCGHCPDLTIYPAIRHDATSYNWKRKRDIFLDSRLYVATPCRWLMDKVEQSILVPALQATKIIPYGIDLNVFHPGAKNAARAALNLPQDADVLLFAANGVQRNRFKDYETMRQAIAGLAAKPRPRQLLFVALGENLPAERVGEAEIRFLPYERDPLAMVRYYQGADIYLHAARVDTFPNAVLEALACGTPVVATAVGGIPEQIKSLDAGGAAGGRHGLDDATGILVPPRDAEALAAAIEGILADGALRNRLGWNAAEDARRRFDLQHEADSYLDWYREILFGRHAAAAAANHAAANSEPVSEPNGSLQLRESR